MSRQHVQVSLRGVEFRAANRRLVVGVGSLFFAVLGQGSGRDAYARAFAIVQMTTSGALLIALLLSIPRGQRPRPRFATSPPG
jgi:hypothetical protein